MGYVIGILNQKGGAGKSTFARTLASYLASQNYIVKIGDFDTRQQTSTTWGARRAENQITPEIEVQAFGRIEHATRQREHYDVMIMDGRPVADELNVEIARISDVIVIPTGLAQDDLDLTLATANSLRKSGIPPKRIFFAIAKAGESELETTEVQELLEGTPFTVLAGSIPVKTSFRRLLDNGQSLVEGEYPSLTYRVQQVLDSLISHMQRLDEEAAETTKS